MSRVSHMSYLFYVSHVSYNLRFHLFSVNFSYALRKIIRTSS